jgi:ABC-2 type transport system ATP-binding protein
MALTETITQLQNYFLQQDYTFAVRRMLDAVMDTRDLGLYKNAIAFVKNFDDKNPEASKNDFEALLLQISNVPAKVVTHINPVALNAKQVCKQYAANGFALQPVNVSLIKGKIIGLVGENGNGKTTLLRLLLGDLKQDTGTIEYNFNLSEKSNYGLKTTIAFIPQRIPKWHGTLLDNLHFAASYYGLHGQENQMWVQLIIARLGLMPYQHLTWNKLSSGYRTRFEIARTLLRRPEVLLLDEPLANLDIISQQTILQDLKYIAQSKAHPMAIMLSSQQIYEVEKVSDAVIFLKKGVSIADNKNDTLTPENIALILEIESTESKEKMMQCFEKFNDVQINFNGGVYIITLQHNATMNEVFNAIITNNINVIAIRNISNSARRFFNN